MNRRDFIRQNAYLGLALGMPLPGVAFNEEQAIRTTDWSKSIVASYFGSDGTLRSVAYFPRGMDNGKLEWLTE